MTQFEGHTEGPWLHCKSPVNGGEQFWSVVDHTQDTDVGDDTLGNWRIADIVDYEVDAKLLAAGPTLLAELKRCYKRIDELEKGPQVTMDGWDIPSQGLCVTVRYAGRDFVGTLDEKWDTSEEE